MRLKGNLVFMTTIRSASKCCLRAYGGKCILKTAYIEYHLTNISEKYETE